MRQELAAIELIQAACHLLPEPYIVINVLLHHLRQVFLRRALDIGGNAVRLGHGLRVTYILTQNEDTYF